VPRSDVVQKKTTGQSRIGLKLGRLKTTFCRQQKVLEDSRLESCLRVLLFNSRQAKRLAAKE